MKTRMRKILGLLLLVGAGVLGYLAYQQWQLYEKGNEEYEELVSDNTDNTDDDDNTDSNIAEEPADAFSLDWNSLLSQNSDIVGWIRMDPTVNYPIVKGTDNSFYLNHGFNQSYNINGCIFMNYQNKGDWTDRNTVVYGHNMINGVMFGNNSYYSDKSYTEAHPYFYIYVPDGKYTYTIFDTMTVYDATTPYEITFQSDDEFNSYLEEMNRVKSYGMDVKVATDDRIVTLSTCTNSGSARFLIQGVLTSFTDNDGKETSAADLKEKAKKEKEEKAKQETTQTESEASSVENSTENTEESTEFIE